LARLATGRENGTDHIAQIFQRVIKFVNFRTEYIEKFYNPSPVGIMVRCLLIKALTNKVNAGNEGNHDFNGKYHEEKYVFRDREVFKDLVRHLQKSSAYWRSVHPVRIIRSASLPRCMAGHSSCSLSADVGRQPDLQSKTSPEEKKLHLNVTL
jgi:hypothetical protein